MDGFFDLWALAVGVFLVWLVAKSLIGRGKQEAQREIRQEQRQVEAERDAQRRAIAEAYGRQKAAERVVMDQETAMRNSRRNQELLEELQRKNAIERARQADEMAQTEEQPD